MTDLTITTAQLTALQPVLAQIEGLSPPPSPKGRYVLAKAAQKATAEHDTYQKAFKAFLDAMVVCDDEGKPIYGEGATAGTVSFTIQKDKVDEFNAGATAMGEEKVTLAGVRQITHAELGDCPITVAMEKVLVECGVLEDAEPA